MSVAAGVPGRWLVSSPGKTPRPSTDLFRPASVQKRRLFEVALPVPLFHTFTYAAPEELADSIAPGSRVVVPVRTRRAVGIVMGGESTRPSGARTRSIVSVADMEPVLSASMLTLCAWIAEYYVVPIGLVLRAVLPAALTAVKMVEPPRKTQRIASIRRELPSLQERDTLFGRAKRQRELYELLESVGGRAPVAHLTEKLKFSAAVLRALTERQLIAIDQEIVDRDPFALRPAPPPARHSPTQAQSAALRTLKSARQGEVFLLHGITGSGKTLVYIEFLREIVEKRGQSAIVLVPEIALTPQTVDRFRSFFGERVAVLHSALSEGERYDEWLALKRGDKRIAVGARSAIFAPLSDLGAIIVDEEHEGSYKNGETPRYHAREVAVIRAREAGAVVVLGSATPSLESWRNAQLGKYGLLSLPERVGAARLPKVHVADLRLLARESLQAGAVSDPFRRVFSEPLERALAERLRRGEQSVLLLNRRGYAAYVQCTACGNVRSCPDCSITLTYHRSPERLICHYCRHEELDTPVCQRCAGTTMKQRGLGTQQVERLLAERFASARIARMDVDTTSGKWAHAAILDRVGAGEVDVLLGTQMIAKGLDFPNVTLVGVVDADVGINLPDFRASERSFQLLSQVAGRAGRGPKGGDVIIQTRLPGHHSVRCALAHDFHAFVAEELPSRDKPPYPPIIRLVNVIFSGLEERATADLALNADHWLRALLARRGAQDIEVTGPAPCPIDRIKKRWRWHLLLKSQNVGGLTRVGRFFIENYDVPSRQQLRIAFDRDPVSVL